MIKVVGSNQSSARMPFRAILSKKTVNFDHLENVRLHSAGLSCCMLSTFGRNKAKIQA